MGAALKIIGGMVAIFLVITYLNTLSPEYDGRVRASNAIEHCRKTVADELLDRSARLLARGACEQMEADFRKKYDMAP